MKCSNCGTEHEGSICPKCGTGGGAQAGSGAAGASQASTAPAACGVGGKKKCGCMKVVVAFAVVVGVIGFLWYMAKARPFLSTAPLAEVVPDDADFFASIDLYNGGRVGLRYARAVGLDNIKKLMGGEEKKEEKKGPDIGVIIEKAQGWVTKEVVLIGSEKDGFAVLIGSHNQGKAEEGFPGILDEAAQAKNQFDKKEHKAGDTKVNVYCTKVNPNEPPKEGALPPMCWASTDRALVIATDEKYANHVVDSIYGKRTDRQKQYMEIIEKEVPSNYVVYAFGAQSMIKSALAEMAQGEGEKKGPDFTKEAEAVRGAIFSIAYDGLSPEYNISLLLDENKAKSAGAIGKLGAFKADVHKIDEVVYPKNAIAYASANNVGGILNMLVADMDEQAREDAGKDLDANVADLAKAVGNEFGVSLLGLDLDKNGNMTIDIVGALEVTGKDGGEALVAAVRRMINEKNKQAVTPEDQITITDSGKNVYLVNIPDVTRFSKKLQPCIGLTDKHLFFSMNPNTLKTYMAGGKGHATGVSSNVSVVVNPSGAAGFANKWFRGNYIDAVKANPKMDEGVKKVTIAKMEKAGKIVNSVFAVYGPMTLSVGIGPDKLFAGFKAEILGNSLSALPYDDIKALSDENGREKAFTGCYKEINDVSTAVEKYKDDLGDGSYAGIDKAGDKLAQVKFFDCMQPDSCKGRIQEEVDKACSKGTFKIGKADEMEYTVEAKPEGLDCSICMGPFTQNYGSYAECIANPKKTCADLAYK